MVLLWFDNAAVCKLATNAKERHDWIKGIAAYKDGHYSVGHEPARTGELRRQIQPKHCAFLYYINQCI